ncbi:MAG: hypothetical protein NZ934_01480 [Hadesarchaea archaeon]|nr:hypothetical protein [Hadesarchaea archaeon]
MFASIAQVQAQLPKGLQLENADVDIYIVLMAVVRCYFGLKFRAPPPPFGTLPTLKGTLELDISSPSPGLLSLSARGDATLPLEMIDDRFRSEIAAIIGRYSMQPEMLNSLLKQVIENALRGLPTSLADMRVQEVAVTKLEWSEPKIAAGLTMTLRGKMFENEKLLEELPLDLEAQLNISGTSATLAMSLSGKRTRGELDLRVTPQAATLELKGSSELPSEGENVRFELAPAVTIGPEQVEKLREMLARNHISLTLRVPADASVDLPPGWRKADSTYAWSGEGASDALAAMLTGEAGISVAYKRRPPTPWLPWAVVAVALIAITGAVIALRRR